jgi:hypothetical protein
MNKKFKRGLVILVVIVAAGLGWVLWYLYELWSVLQRFH